jgi:Domain of unknown function (DUF1844)
MSQSDQSDKPFTVSDRRHFTPEGRPRDDDADAGAPPSQQAVPPTPDPGQPADEPPADFSQFLMGLAAEAARLLAGEGVPEGTPRAETLAGARSMVAILEMLKDKTEGRRTPGEDTLLAELLFQLRMAYVERTRAGQA